MISKSEFVNIINRLKATEDTADKVNEIIRNSVDCEISDFTHAGSLMICHADIVIRLLQNMFNDKFENISYFIYDLDYGRKYKKGMITEADGRNIDLSTAEKLYDYLTR